MGEELVEYAHISQVRAFKCNNNNGLGPLFILMFHKTTYKGKPTDPTSFGTVELSGRRCVPKCMRLRSGRTLKDVVGVPGLFLYTETVEKIARELETYLDTRFVFDETILEYMVFVVDVEATYGSEDYVEDMEALLDSTIRDSDRDCDRLNVDCSTATDDGNNKDLSLIVDDKEYNLISLVDAKKDVDDSMYVDVDMEDPDVYIDDVEVGDDYGYEDEVDMDDLDVHVDGVEVGDDYGYEDEDEDEEEEYMNDIIIAVEIWAGENPLLEEVHSKIKIERLESRWNGCDYVIKQEEEKHGECAICLATYPGKIPRNAQLKWLTESHSCELVRLGCGHGFHHRCIFRWLDKCKSCPLCRSPSHVVVRDSGLSV